MYSSCLMMQLIIVEDTKMSKKQLSFNEVVQDENDSDEAYRALLKAVGSQKSKESGKVDLEEAVLKFFEVTSGGFTITHVNRLMQLGYSGSGALQRLFVKVMDKIIGHQSIRDYLFKNSSENSNGGMELLNRLVNCIEFQDDVTRNIAISATEKLTADIKGE